MSTTTTNNDNNNERVCLQTNKNKTFMNQVLYSLLEEYNLDKISVIEVMIGAKGSYNNPILH